MYEKGAKMSFQLCYKQIIFLAAISIDTTKKLGTLFKANVDFVITSVNIGCKTISRISREYPKMTTFEPMSLKTKQKAIRVVMVYFQSLQIIKKT